MSYEKLELLIAGEFRGGSEGKTEPVINPATEEVLGEVPHASAADLDRALEASAEGFKVWRARTPLQRQQVMEKAARLMEDRIDAMARTLTMEMGKPLAEAKMELQFVIDVHALVWRGGQARLWPPRPRAHARRAPDGDQGACRPVPAPSSPGISPA